MTRRVTDKIITAEGRDKSKRFKLTELDAYSGEEWANTFFFAIANAGGKLPDEVMNKGMAGLSAIGVGSAILQAMRTLQYETVKPLFDQMLTCIVLVHAADQPPLPIRPYDVNCPVEEISTFWTLRLAWIELHTGFSVAALRRDTDSQAASQPA